MNESKSTFTEAKRVLVTGGAGFLGSHLCDRLIEAGHDVICLDNFYTGRKDNIRHLMDNPSFEVMRHDVNFPLYVEVDQIYNLACPASPVHYQHDPVQTTKTSVHGAINMLGLAKRVGARILQASTSEVYGDPSVHPQTEDYWGNVNPIGPRSCYDEGKRCAETLFFDYHRQHNLDIKVVRIFNTYGPRMHPHDGRVVSNFIVQALGGDPITIYGDGSQTRSFCYVDDLVEAIIRMMNSREGFTGPVNIGNPGEFTIKELAEKVIELTGSKSQIVYKPLPQDDPLQRQPNISLAQKELGWEPVVDLSGGLQRTVDYFKNLNSGVSLTRPAIQQIHEIKFSIPKKYRRGALRDDEWASVQSGIANISYISELIGVEDWSKLEVLDYGCGVKFAQALVQLNVEPRRYAGLDVYSNMIEYLVENCPLHSASFENVPFGNAMYNPSGPMMTSQSSLPVDGKFDLIVLQSVFTHFAPEDFKSLLHILRRYVKENGRIFFTCFIGANQKADFVDMVPDRPLLKASYRKEVIERYLAESGWRVDSFNIRSHKHHVNDHYLCSPI